MNVEEKKKKKSKGPWMVECTSTRWAQAGDLTLTHVRLRLIGQEQWNEKKNTNLKVNISQMTGHTSLQKEQLALRLSANLQFQ